MAGKVSIIVTAKDNASQVFKKISGSTKEMEKSIEGVNKQQESFGKRLLNFGMQVGPYIGAIGAAGVAMKKAFDLAKEGAAIEQTTQSFNGLIARLGVAPDLLEQLRRASRGTVDDMSLMSSTLTLVAGASDELATAMMSNAPRLMEIAKAANKLNPALGDVNFMYNSLMTGIKRSSPLILDNLGLIVKVGDANEQYAASLGKSVEQLTAEEQKIALLNAALSAGGQLIEQAGGDIDSLTDDYTRLTTEIENATNAIKVWWTTIAGGAAGGLNRVIEGNNELNQAQERGIKNSHDWAAAIINAIFYQEDYARQLANTREEVGRYDEAQARANFQTIREEEAMRQLREATIAYADGTLQASSKTEILRARIEGAKPSAEDLAAVMEMTGDAIYNAGTAFEDASGGASSFASALADVRAEWEGITTLSSLESKIQNFWDELTYDQLGFSQFEQDFAKIDAAPLGEEVKKELTMKGAAGVAAIQMETGKLSFDEAASNLENAFGIAADQARALLHEAISGMNFTAYVDLVINSIAGGGTIGKPNAGKVSPAVTHSEVPSVIKWNQAGGDYIVPPGFNNDSFMFAATSGERVQVTPQGRGGGSDGMILFENHFYITSPDAGASVISKLNKQMRLAQVAGAGYAGV